MDELTSVNLNEAESEASGSESAGPRNFDRSMKLGLLLCLFGALLLILAGFAVIFLPSLSEQVSESSVISLNGTGFLFIFCVLIMTAGIFLIFRRI